MKNKLFPYLLFMTATLLGSCASEDEFVPAETVGEVQKVTFSVPSLTFDEDEVSTRATMVKDGSTYRIRWSEGDVIGVYPNEGSQIDFPIKNLEENNPVFDGGGWALKKDYRYAAYFPYSYDYTDKTAIPLNYVGQKQVGNNNMDFINSYNYFASNEAIVAKSSSLDFTIGYLGHLLRFAFTMPEAGNYTKLRINSSDIPLAKTAQLDISGDYPNVYDVDCSNTLTMTLENVRTTSANELITIYMWLCPRDLTNTTLTAEIESDEGKIYRTTMKSQNYPAGKATGFTRPNTTYSIEFVGYAPEVIQFEDPEVKRICVENWDTNSDGELDKAEAAAVNYLNLVFAYNTDINSFNELQYFTGLDVIDHDAFSGCTNLSTIQIPEGVTTIGTNAFENCTDLYKIDLPESVTTICDFAFGNCTNLYHVTMPGVTSIGVSAFYYTKLSDFTLSPVLEEIGSNAFSHVTGLYTLYLPATLTSIGDYAFAYSSLSYVSLESDEEGYVKDYVLTTIPEAAFVDCANLQYLNIPSSVTTIERVAFSGCTAMHTIDLPSGLEAIGEGAFENTSLLKIDIPETVTELGSFAFWVNYDCLQYIIWRNPIQITSESIFTYNDSPIYVPQFMVEQTKAWYPDDEDGNGYAHRIKSIESMYGGGEGSTTATMPDLNFTW